MIHVGSLREELEFWGIPLPESLSVDTLAESLKGRPMENTLAVVGLATLLFYQAEKGQNPKVNDIYDALTYCSTNISVGYSDIFAKTPLGKVIGSILMTIGPAMAATTLDGPKRAMGDPVQAEILATLKEILGKLGAESRDEAGKTA